MFQGPNMSMHNVRDSLRVRNVVMMPDDVHEMVEFVCSLLTLPLIYKDRVVMT